MKKIMISGLVALVFTSCTSTKSVQLATEGQPSWPIEEANLTTKVELKEQFSTLSNKTSYESESHHKEGWIHPAER